MEGQREGGLGVAGAGLAMAQAQAAMMRGQQACSVPSSCAHGEISGVGGAAGGRICSVSFRGAALASPLKCRGTGRVQRVVAAATTTSAVLGLEKEVSEAAAAPKVGVGEEFQGGPAMEVDAVTVAELKENGFRSTRRTKLVCTIGPATCAPEQLEALAMGGMNVARLNMCHGTRDWHTQVIRSIRNLNSEKGYSVAIMMDTEGSEIHLGDFNGAASVKAEVSPSHPTPRSSHTTSCLLEFQSNNSQVSEKG